MVPFILINMPYILGTYLGVPENKYVLFFNSKMVYGDNFSSIKSASPERIRSGNQIFRRQYPSTFYTRDFHICQTELLSLQRLSHNSLYLLQCLYPFLNIQYSFKNTVQRHTVLLPPLCWNQTNQNSWPATELGSFNGRRTGQ